MADLYRGLIPIIRRSLDEGFLRGMPQDAPSTGCVPRDYDVDPVLMGDSPAGMPLIDPSNYDAAYDEMMATQSMIEHKYLYGGKPAFEFLDQNGFPDCWSHSTPHGVMLDRVKQNLPVIRFNGVAVATMLKQTNGGWCGLSMKFGRENGFPVVGTGPGQWPYQTRSNHDTPELRANMATHKITEDWYDLGRREYDQVLTKGQLMTCGLNAMPGAVDFNIFSHSMGFVGVARIEAGHYGPIVLNQWKGWGYFGLGVLSGIWPDNAVIVRSSNPSVV